MAERVVTLNIQKNGVPERAVTLPLGTLRLGRAEDNEICLADIGVSRRHARIVIDERGVVFEDSGSGNGSWFNNRRVQSHQVMDGDEISIEPFVLRFNIAEPVAEATDQTDRTIVLQEAMDFLDPESNHEAPSARLELISEYGADESEYAIPPGGLTMGRADLRDIVLNDPAASRLHAEVVLRGSRFWIRDSGSANGVVVNGRRIQEHPLANGDVIRIGASEFRYVEREDQPFHTEVLEEEPVERTEAFVGSVEDGAWEAALNDRPAANGLPPAPTTPSKDTGGFGRPPAGIGPTGTHPLPPASGFGSVVPPAGPASGFGGPPPTGFGAPPPTGFGAPAAAAPPRPMAPPSAPPPSMAPPPGASFPPGGGLETTASGQGRSVPPPFAAPGAAPPGMAPPVGSVPPPMGASAPGSFGVSMGPPPDLGDAPADGGFGGLEMDLADEGGGAKRKRKRLKSKRLKTRKSSDSFFSKPINRISIGLLVVSVGGVLAKKGLEAAKMPDRPTLAGAQAKVEIDPATLTEDEQLRLAQINRQMDEGMRLFQNLEYLSAADKFLKVLTLDPNHEAAQRMGYLSCEFIAIQAMQAAVKERAMDDAARQEVKDAAMAAYEEALKNLYKVTPALKQVEEALEVNEGDEDLTTARDELKKKSGELAYAATQQNLKKLEEECSELYELGSGELSRRNYNAAINYFQQILNKDTGGTTTVAPKAEEGIRRAKAEMARGAREVYQQGLNAQRSGDFLGARAKFRETLRIDPYNASAQAKLAEVQAQLEKMAVTEFQKGKTMEQANQPDRAMGHYQQVLTLVDDRGNSTYQNADARIKALLK